MFQQSFITPIRSISCFIHKKQKSTHLCTDLQCITNPILCNICLSDPKFRNPHLNHQSSIKPINQAIQFLALSIKSQIKSNQSIYQKTIGHKDNQILRMNLDKMEYLTEEIQTRINNIKMQVDIQMEILIKQFQRLMLLEKQQFIRKLQQYKKIFINNLDLLKKQTNQIMMFQNSLKFYSNPNTLLLKLSTQAQKKSLDWLMQQKKILYKISKQQNSYFSTSSFNTLQSYISKANQMNMMLKPIWNGQKKQSQNEKQLKSWIKNNVQAWALIPELKDLSKSILNQQQQNNNNNNNNQNNNNNNNQNNQNTTTNITSQQFRSGPYSQMYPYSNSYLTNIN